MPFAALRQVPAWLVAPPEQRRRWAVAAAVLHHRPAVDAEVRGEVLAPVAAVTGEALFDVLCATPVVDGAIAAPLPSADEMTVLGENLLRDALPSALGGREDDYARRLFQATDNAIGRAPA